MFDIAPPFDLQTRLTYFKEREALIRFHSATGLPSAGGVGPFSSVETVAPAPENGVDARRLPSFCLSCNKTCDRWTDNRARWCCVDWSCDPPWTNFEVDCGRYLERGTKVDIPTPATDVG